MPAPPPKLIARGLLTAGLLLALPAGARDAAPLPRLTAVVVAGALREAMLTDAAGWTVTVHEGGQAGGYTVTRITPGAAVLTGADGPHALRLGPDVVMREQTAAAAPMRLLTDPAYREAHTETDQ